MEEEHSEDYHKLSALRDELDSATVMIQKYSDLEQRYHVEVSTTKELLQKLSRSKGNHIEALSETFVQRRVQKRRDAEVQEVAKIPYFELLSVFKDGQEQVLIHDRLVSTSVAYDLIILIPSLTRYNTSNDGREVEYLDTVLAEYDRQLSELSANGIQLKVLIIVHAFIDEKFHKVFYDTKRKYHQRTEFIFMVPPIRFRDPYSDLFGVNYASPNNPYPGKIARQQTCDVLLMTKFVLNTFKFKYLMYSEDDFVPCPAMLDGLFKSLVLVEDYHSTTGGEEKGFCSLKLTVGLGGSILTKPVAEMFLKYSKDNIDLNPVDVLIDFILYWSGENYETCVTRGLTSYISQFSNLTHIGGISNWEERNDKKQFGERDFHCKHKLNLEWHLGKRIGLSVEERKCHNEISPVIPCV